MLTAFNPRIHHFAVSVADLDATATWYRDKLGFSEDYRYGVPAMGLEAAFLVLGDVRLEIFQMSRSRPAGEDEQALERYLGVRGLKHIAFAVDDVHAARPGHARRGVPFVNDVMDVPNSGGERFCFFTDPDGVLVELFQAAARHRH